MRHGRVVHHLDVDEAVLSPGGSGATAPTSSLRPGSASPGRNQSSTRPPTPGRGDAANGNNPKGANARGNNPKGGSPKGAKGNGPKGNAPGGTSGNSQPGSRPTGGGDRKAERRVEAEERNTRGRASREVRKGLERLERQAAQADDELRTIQQKLADPTVYADKAVMNDLIDAHDKAEAKATRLLEEWERAAHELEAHDATTTP